MYIYYVLGTLCYMIFAGNLMSEFTNQPITFRDFGPLVVFFAVTALIVFGLTFVFKKGASQKQRVAMTYAGTGIVAAAIALLP